MSSHPSLAGQAVIKTPLPGLVASDQIATFARHAEALVIPLAALLVGFGGFAVFLLLLGHSPADFYTLVYKAGFASLFSWQNTLTRAAPLILTALCVAVPARLGLIVIGGEGALVVGGVATGALASVTIGVPGLSNWPLSLAMLSAAGALAGGMWLGLTGLLRYWRGVNETIASLLLTYIAIALMNHLVEGPLRDPASLNKPSTLPLSATQRLGSLPGLDVHWGFAIAVLAAVLLWLLMARTTWGFAARIVGGNPRAAQLQGLPVGYLMVTFTALGGAAAGLAGAIEVMAVHGSANGSLAGGIGYGGILVAFLARQNALAILPVAVLLGGFDASSGLVQRRMDLPDATILVLQGIVFIAILASDTLYGRFKCFSPERWSKAT